MSRYALDKLASEIAAMPVCDEKDFLAFLPLAARLAALGDGSQLRRWPEVVKPFQHQVTKLLVDRGHEGVWHLRNTLGEDLGLAVISAQDFACFLALERDMVPAAARSTLSVWFDEAENTPLDEDAVETLEVFLRRFPIPDELRLNIVDTPLSTFEEAILASRARPRPTQEVSWPVAVSLPEAVYALESDSPSDVLRDNFEKADVPVQIDGFGSLLVSRRLDEDWRVLIDMRREDGRPLGVESVRLGLFSAVSRNPERDDCWEIDLKHVDYRNRMATLRDTLVVNFRNGSRLRIC